jgi:pSer/pThr/pTyr-binding forkhead associated (FHA) protein
VITVDGSVATIEDLGSKNGTFLRGRRLEAPTRLADADEIQIGVNVARFRVVVADERTATEKL